MKLQPGMMIMHKQKAVRLLHIVSEGSDYQRWKVTLLFVEPKEETVLIHVTDHVSHLHTKAA